MEMLRFFLVSALGVILDISIAYVLATQFGVKLWIAATVSFLVVAGINYILHELWTFSDGTSHLSGRRAGSYLAVSMVTLLVRIACVAFLTYCFGSEYPLAILFCSAGISFFANYCLSKFMVFSNKIDVQEYRK